MVIISGIFRLFQGYKDSLRPDNPSLTCRPFILRCRSLSSCGGGWRPAQPACPKQSHCGSVTSSLVVSPSAQLSLPQEYSPLPPTPAGKFARSLLSLIFLWKYISNFLLKSTFANTSSPVFKYCWRWKHSTIDYQDLNHLVGFMVILFFFFLLIGFWGQPYFPFL